MGFGLNVTANSIVRDLKEIATGTALSSHAQIKDFFFGQYTDVNAKNKSYPLLWVDTLPSKLMGEFGNVVRMKFRVAYFELLDKDLANDLSAESTAQLVLMDILRQMYYTYGYAVNYQETGTITQGKESLGANLSGAYLDMVIDVPYDWVYGTCDYPTKQNQGIVQELSDYDSGLLVDYDGSPLKTI
jgi:hypothetical protein